MYCAAVGDSGLCNMSFRLRKKEMKFPPFFLSPRRKQNCQSMQPCNHLHICHRVHMSYQTVSDLPGRHSFLTVSATPPSFSPSPVKREPDYADAARTMLDRAHPEYMTWMCTHAWHSTQAEACPEPESVYAKYLCRAFLLSLFPTSKMDCHMC